MKPNLRVLLWATLAATLLTVFAMAFLPEKGRSSPLPVLHPAGSFHLTNQLGAPVSAEDLRGTVTVVDVVFSRCPTQCHRLSLLMGGLQGRLPTGTRLVSLTADPGYDTPEMLLRYGKKYQADTARWWFLTGPKAELYRYATKDLWFTVMGNPDPHATLEDLFIHSMDFVLLDRQGRMREVVHGDDPGVADQILSDVNRLLKETPR